MTLRRDLAGAPGTDAASLVTTGRALVTVRDWTFLLGPGLMPGINALLLGWLLYRSGLVPRVIPVLGLIGAPVLIASATAALFRGNDPGMSPAPPRPPTTTSSFDRQPGRAHPRARPHREPERDQS